MRSDVIKKGAPAAPNRSLLYALGYTKEELERPLIGVVCSYNEIVPGHMNLDKIAEAVKAGIRAAGGTPVEFPAIAVCDGIAMGHVGMKYSLVTRDLIADSTEAMAMAHQFDGLVMIPNCDKNVPGLLMAAARINIPTIFCSGGPMLAGRLKDGRRTCLSHMFEAVGSYYAGKLDEAGVEEYENNACPTCGSCSGMYTANSMNCLTEAIGMGLRGNGTIPAVWSARLRLAKHAGMQIMDLVAKNIRPRDIMTEAAFHNAETLDMALGCSTNTMLHLPAIAHECGIELDLDLSNEISSKTPNLCHLAPAGDTYMEDLEGAGGVYAVMKELTKRDLLDTSVMTVTGKTMAENLEGVVNRDPQLIRPIDNPYSKDGGKLSWWEKIGASMAQGQTMQSASNMMLFDPDMAQQQMDMMDDMSMSAKEYAEYWTDSLSTDGLDRQSEQFQTVRDNLLNIAEEYQKVAQSSDGAIGDAAREKVNQITYALGDAETRADLFNTVSYTHLTLPTICSV